MSHEQQLTMIVTQVTLDNEVTVVGAGRQHLSARVELESVYQDTPNLSHVRLEYTVRRSDAPLLGTRRILHLTDVHEGSGA